MIGQIEAYLLVAKSGHRGDRRIWESRTTQPKDQLGLIITLYNNIIAAIGRRSAICPEN